MEDIQMLRTQYSYWREFLLRSKKYEMVCEAIRETKESVGWPEQFKNWVTSNGELNYDYLEWVIDNDINTKAKHKFAQNGLQFSSHLTASIYPLFQDIFRNDFEETWNRVLIYYTGASSPKAVYDGVRAVAELFEGVEIGLSATLQHEPSLKEFKEEFFSALVQLDKSRRLLSVASFGYTKNKIVSDFRDELSKLFVRVGSDKPSRLIQYPWAIYEPTGSITPEQFNKYLKSYDAKAGTASTREAMRLIYPELDPDVSENYEEYERSFRRHCAKAKRLIQNAEIANFPGKITNSQ